MLVGQRQDGAGELSLHSTLMKLSHTLTDKRGNTDTHLNRCLAEKTHANIFPPYMIKSPGCSWHFYLLEYIFKVQVFFYCKRWRSILNGSTKTLREVFWGLSKLCFSTCLKIKLQPFLFTACLFCGILANGLMWSMWWNEMSKWQLRLLSHSLTLKKLWSGSHTVHCLFVCRRVCVCVYVLDVGAWWI